MKNEKYICPGCKVVGEHKCHNKPTGSCFCSECRTPNKAHDIPRQCTCYDCVFERTIQKFQNMFSEEEQDDIYDFLDFRVTFRERNKNSAKIQRIMEKK